MVKRRVPAEFASVDQSKQPTAVTASPLSIEHINICPHCNQPMPILLVNGIPAHVCAEHRNVFPTRDEDRMS